MTYFSRIRLNPTRRDTRRLVGSPQAMHAAVMGSHPLGSSPDEGRVLWRLDRHANHDLELYVVSPSEPDFTGLVEQAGWPKVMAWDTTDYGLFLGRLGSGQRWAFRLTANPVRAVAVEGGRGRVTPHLTVAQQEQWLIDHGSSWGFEVPNAEPASFSVSVRERHTAGFSRATPGSGGSERGRVAITRADFLGQLVVTDAKLLRRALTYGMGRAKAYGCGLMTLARS